MVSRPSRFVDVLKLLHVVSTHSDASGADVFLCVLDGVPSLHSPYVFDYAGQWVTPQAG